MSGRISALSSNHHHLSTTIIHTMPPLRQSKRISKRATDQDASKISTRSTSRNASAAPAASLPTATGGNNTTLDAAACIININDAPPGTGGNTTTQDAAKSIIDINDASRPPNAKSFGAIVNELRSRPVAVPLNVRQRMLSSGLNPTSYLRGQVRLAPQKFKDIVVATPPHPQASYPGVREDVAAAATTAAYSERYRSESKNDNNSEGGCDTDDLDYGDSFSVSDFWAEGDGGGRRGAGGGL
jgi:hypothetical protein